MQSLSKTQSNNKNNNKKNKNNKGSLVMLHLPLSHVWFSLLYHNSLLFFYFNRLLSIRPFFHTLSKKSNCYNVSSLHSLNSALMHPSRNVFHRISDIKIKNPVCYECSLSINHSFFTTSVPIHPSHPSLSKQPSHSSLNTSKRQSFIGHYHHNNS